VWGLKAHTTRPNEDARPLHRAVADLHVLDHRLDRSLSCLPSPKDHEEALGYRVSGYVGDMVPPTCEEAVPQFRPMFEIST